MTSGEVFEGAALPGALVVPIVGNLVGLGPVVVAALRATDLVVPDDVVTWAVPAQDARRPIVPSTVMIVATLCTPPSWGRARPPGQGKVLTNRWLDGPPVGEPRWDATPRLGRHREGSGNSSLSNGRRNSYPPLPSGRAGRRAITLSR